MKRMGRQLPGCCGTQSLSYCIEALTGQIISQMELACDCGAPISIYKDGVDENQLARAIRANNLTAKFIKVDRKSLYREFFKRLRGQIAIVVTMDNLHWEAILGYKKGMFTKVDPLDGLVRRYSMKSLKRILWNDDEDEMGFFAIVIKKKK